MIATTSGSRRASASSLSAITGLPLRVAVGAQRRCDTAVAPWGRTTGSSVYPSEDGIDTGDRRDHVGEQRAFAERGHRLHVVERRVPDVDPATAPARPGRA